MGSGVSHCSGRGARGPSRGAAVAWAVVAVVLLWVIDVGIVDDFGRDYTEEGFNRALVTFGVVRGLNAVISMAQGTEVAVEPVGIGMTFAPGEVLDPVNDLVERFSWVVLASATSLGIQRVLLDVTAWWWFTALVNVAVVAALLSRIWGWPARAEVRAFLVRVAAILVILRLSVPVAAIGGEMIYALFLESRYVQSTEELERTAQTISTLNDQTRQPLSSDGGSSFVDHVKRAYASAAGVFEMEDRIEAFRVAAAQISEQALDLIVVFVLQNLLLPLAFLWIVVQLLKRALSLAR